MIGVQPSDCPAVARWGDHLYVVVRGWFGWRRWLRCWMCDLKVRVKADD